MTPRPITLPDGRTVRVVPRAAMRGARRLPRAHAPCPRPGEAMPVVPLPIDWTKGDTLDFPLLGNDVDGDCMLAAALHADQTWQGNVATAPSYGDAETIAYYLKLAGGDYGLDETTLVQGWRSGLDDDPSVNIADALDVDPLDARLVQWMVSEFGGFLLMLALPDDWWQNWAPGYVWDAGPGITANPDSGHGVWVNGVDWAGRYKVQTWGSHNWLTPRGMAVCDPSAFACFSDRQFGPRGANALGRYRPDAAALWRQAGGSVV